MSDVVLTAATFYAVFWHAMAFANPAYFVDKLSCRKLDKGHAQTDLYDVVAWARLIVVFSGTWAFFYHATGSLLLLLPADMTFDDASGKPFPASWVISLIAGFIAAIFLQTKIQTAAAALDQRRATNEML